VLRKLNTLKSLAKKLYSMTTMRRAEKCGVNVGDYPKCVGIRGSNSLAQIMNTTKQRILTLLGLVCIGYDISTDQLTD
jgi:hypothetical protein